MIRAWPQGRVLTDNPVSADGGYGRGFVPSLPRLPVFIWTMQDLRTLCIHSLRSKSCLMSSPGRSEEVFSIAEN